MVGEAEIQARMPDGARAVYRVRYARASEDWTMEVEGPHVDSASVTAGDVFACLWKLREEVEPRGVRLLCAGARRDVFPSGMSRQMGGGVKAYRCTLGRPATGDLVNIFDFAEPEEVVTVAEQKAYHEEWVASLRR